jgi:hypothetical protein
MGAGAAPDHGGWIVTVQGQNPRADPSSRAPDGVPVELIDHAVRCWEAEVENARRHAARLNLLLPAILAVLGFGAFNLSWLGKHSADLEPIWVVWIVKVLLLGSLLLFMRAVWILLAVRQRRRVRPTASHALRLGRDAESDPAALDPQTARGTAFERTYTAAAELRRRNAAEGMRIDRGQQALLVAILHALLAVACYTLFAIVP